MKRKIYLGGNKRHYLGDSMWDSDSTPSDRHVEYAAHLKVRHKCVQYHFDGAHEHTQMYLRQHEMADFDVNDEVAVILLAEGSHLQNVVFHNKKPAPGVKISVLVNGTASDKPTDLPGLLAAVTAAKDELSAKVAELAAADEGEKPAKRQAKEEAEAKLAAAQKAYDDANATNVLTKDIDLEKTGYHLVRLDKMLQSNGDVSVVIKKGSLLDTCWTVSTDLVHHNDQHGCSCAPQPCETPYPDPLCM